MFQMGCKIIETAKSGRAGAMLIRNESQGDAEAIHGLTERAFAPMRFSDGTEAGSSGGCARQAT
jgi:predicted N-acetyltransferase YhbS